MLEYIGYVILGLAVGFLSGMFGVGGGFLLTPLLNILFNIPYNIAAGSSLAAILVTSFMGSIKHRSLKNIDYKLAVFLIAGSLAGVFVGINLLEVFKKTGNIFINGKELVAVNFYLSVIYIVLLLGVGVMTFVESSKAKKRPAQGGRVDTAVNKRIKELKLYPIITLPHSGLESMSVSVIVLSGFAVGLTAGLVGAGGGFILNPVLIYALGVPTTITIGTGLFTTVFSSFFGTVGHLFKSNINFSIVFFCLLGSLIGVSFGANITKQLRGAHIRFYFSLILFFAAGMIFVKLLSTIL